MIRDHLVFVMDNFHLIDYTLDKKDAKYIIAAFNADDIDHTNNEIFQDLNQNIKAI